MRTAKPFFLSVGIHLSLGVLIFGTLFTIQKIVPTSTEKIVLKIISDNPVPIPLPLTVQPKIEPKTVPQSKSIPVPKPIKTVLPSLPQSHPQATQTPIASPTISKTVEIAPIVVPKATPPPPPKIEENYVEENLGRIRTILAERLKYPKNALRLKQQGECIVTFSLGTDREVSQITITQSSGFDLLDDAAKALIETSASEFPKPKKPVRISVPIAYKLR